MTNPRDAAGDQAGSVQAESSIQPALHDERSVPGDPGQPNAAQPAAASNEGFEVVETEDNLEWLAFLAGC